MKKNLPSIVLRAIRQVVLAAVLTAFPSSLLWAQVQEEAPLQTFGAAGMSVTTAQGEIFSFTLGQTAFARFGGSSFSVDEGVQQVFCIPAFDTVEYAFCQNVAAASLAAILPADYVLPAEVTPSIPGSYAFVVRTINQGGCDSIVWFMLTVYPTADTTLNVQTDTCYRWFGIDYTESGTASHTLTTVNGCDSVLTLNLVVMPADHPLPEIYAMMDVLLMVNHKVQGYDSVDYPYYRWYKDGKLVAEGRHQDSYSENGNKLRGCFYVEVATASDTHYWSSSNEICIGVEGIASVENSVSLTLAPNPASKGSRVKAVIQIDEHELQGARLMLYDAQGRTVYQTTAHTLTYIPADMPAGVYSVHVILSDGRHAARKLVIR